MTIATYLPKTNEALIWPEDSSAKRELRAAGSFETPGQMRCRLTGTTAPKLRDALRKLKAVSSPDLQEEIYNLCLNPDESRTTNHEGRP